MFSGRKSLVHEFSPEFLSTRGIRDRLSWFMINGFLILFALTTIYPFIWLIYNSMKTRAEFAQNIFSLPGDFRLDNYIAIFNKGTVFPALFSSFFNSVVSTALVILLAFVVAYFLARFRFRGRNFLYLFFLFGLLLPIPALLVPIFIQFKTINLIDTRFTLLLPYVGFGLSSAIFLIESYIRAIPLEIDEAAVIDGASLPMLMARVIFPICRPIIATVSILGFLGHWNEFAFALVLIRSEVYKTIPLWLRTFRGEYMTDFPGMMAGMVIASIPVVIVYLIFREKVVEGFVGGAVKF